MPFQNSILEHLQKDPKDNFISLKEKKSQIYKPQKPKIPRDNKKAYKISVENYYPFIFKYFLW